MGSGRSGTQFHVERNLYLSCNEASIVTGRLFYTFKCRIERKTDHETHVIKEYGASSLEVGY